jgi:hypothetical protein
VDEILPELVGDVAGVACGVLHQREVLQGGDRGLAGV